MRRVSRVFVAAAVGVVLVLNGLPAAAVEASAVTLRGSVHFPEGVTARTDEVRAYSVGSDGLLALAGSVYLAADGTFQIKGLQPGEYKLRFEAITSNVLDEWWGGGTGASAKTLTLSAQGDHAPVEFTPLRGATITGRLSFDAAANPDGNRDGAVYAYPSGAGARGDYIEAGSTDPYSGIYTIDQLPAGEYKIRFISPSSPSVFSEWWRDALDWELADTLVLETGESRAGVDATLSGDLHQHVVDTPVISGEARAGETLTLTPGSWTPGASLTVTWYADGESIWGYGTSLALTAAHIGKTITASVAANKSGYQAVSVTSAPTAAVLPRKQTGATPVIGSAPQVGIPIWAEPGEWPADTALEWQWYADGARLDSETQQYLTPAAELFSKRLTVRVTGSRSGYETVTMESAPSEPVRGGEMNVAIP